MVKKELKLKEFLNLEDELKAKSRVNLTIKTILGTIIHNNGKIKKDSLKSLDTLAKLKVSSVEINKVIKSLIDENLIEYSTDKNEIHIKKSKDFYSKLSIIYKLLLAGEMTIEAYNALKSKYYLELIDKNLIAEIQKIQGGLSLNEEVLEKTIKFLKWFPSALSWALNPDEGFINANKQKETDEKTELDIESIIRNDFFQKLILLGMNDLRYEIPRIYLKEVHGIDTFSTSRKIIFKKDSKIEETLVINELKKIGIIADGWVGTDGSKYAMTLGQYSEDSDEIKT